MSPETVAAVALDILREKGWHQGGLEGDDGSLCMVAAAVAATGHTLGEWTGLRDRAPFYSAVSNLTGQEVPTWNDDPHTTFEDVALVLKRVANGEGFE